MSKLEKLLRQLGAGDRPQRHAVAAELLTHALAGGSIDSAAVAIAEARQKESDRELRAYLAVLLLHHHWWCLDYKFALPAMAWAIGADNAECDAAREIVEEVLQHPGDVDHVASLLPPILTLALAHGPQALRLPTLRAMKYALKHGATLESAEPDLLALLSDPELGGHVQTLLLLAVGGGQLALSPQSLTLLADGLDKSDRYGQFQSARLLCATHVQRGDLVATAHLLADERLPVREGAHYQLAREDFGSADLSPLVPVLAASLGDAGGGVVFHAMGALWKLAQGGVDLSAAGDALTSMLAEQGYSAKNWTHGKDLLGLQDLSDENPGTDAAALLTAHYLANGNAASVKSLLASEDPWVRRGAQRGLNRFRDVYPATSEAIDAQFTKG